MAISIAFLVVVPLLVRRCLPLHPLRAVAAKSLLFTEGNTTTPVITPVVPWCRPSGLTRPPVGAPDPAPVREGLCRLHLKPAS